MLIYQSTKDGFLADNRDRMIEDVVAQGFLDRTGRYAADGEYRSWQGSLPYMAKVLGDPAIPGDVGVAIEYGIPQSSKRIDFLISGHGDDDAANLIIVELKQWSEAKLPYRIGLPFGPTIRRYLSRARALAISAPAWSQESGAETHTGIHLGTGILSACKQRHFSSSLRDGTDQNNESRKA
jgi:hypothetical protein